MTAVMIEYLGPQFQMWVLFTIVIGALVLYAMERLPMEVTSFGVVCILLVFFHFFPVAGPDGGNRLDDVRILKGFANPALITVLALLVLGQGMIRTGVLDLGARWIMTLGGSSAWFSIAVILIVVMAISAFLNNIPVVVIFIPIMQALASRYGMSVGKVMIPLSFAAVLGGMTTLIGSGTNLLVNSALIEMGKAPFGFFDFSIPGLVMAAAGLVFLMTIAPKLLPDRAAGTDALYDTDGKQFVAQITIEDNSELIGAHAPGGHFAAMPDDIVIRTIQRGEEAILPPFEDYVGQLGDTLVVAGTRKALTDVLSHNPGLFYPDLRDGRASEDEDYAPWHDGERVLAEVMVTPASRLIGQTLSQIGFRYHTHCIVMAIKRRSHMVRGRMTDIYLRAGDELLVMGQTEDVIALKASRDVVLVGWSDETLPAVKHARRSMLIFLGVVLMAGTGVVPIVVAALTGAAGMVATGVLTVRDATRAIDPLIVATIGTALALGIALQETGGAQFIAHGMATAMKGVSPAVMLSLFFLLVAVLSNIISTKTTAVLFTPIAIDFGIEVGAAPEAFAVAVIFAANCSFASPLGYQTNLLVMGPGHYKFMDFTRVGIPLVFVMWITFSLFAPWYYGV
jgi:di/tricarboxylate transporter